MRRALPRAPRATTSATLWRETMGSFPPFEAVQPTILTVPGLGGSGPSHWQTLWEQARADTVRAELGMWHTPHRNAWVTKLD